MNALLAHRLESVPQTDFHQQRHDEQCSAIEYMKSHNVAPEVIERVLLNPQQRRKERR